MLLLHVVRLSTRIEAATCEYERGYTIETGGAARFGSDVRTLHSRAAPPPPLAAAAIRAALSHRYLVLLKV